MRPRNLGRAISSTWSTTAASCCQRALRNASFRTGHRPQHVGGHACCAVERGQSGRACAEPPSRPSAPRSGGGAQRRALTAVSTRARCRLRRRRAYHNILLSTASEKPAHFCARQHLLLPWVAVRNLASAMLARGLSQLVVDWPRHYKLEPWLVETLVDPGRHHGGCYRAANWVALGATSGRGRMDRHGPARPPCRGGAQDGPGVSCSLGYESGGCGSVERCEPSPPAPLHPTRRRIRRPRPPSFTESAGRDN